MSGTTTPIEAPPPGPIAPEPVRPDEIVGDGRGSVIPTWTLISTKLLEIRRRRGLMTTVFLLTLGLPVIVLGLRILFHAIDPKSFGPAGSPTVFSAISSPIAEFGFIAGAVLGASAGTTDLSDGVFRHLVITGRSRIALYMARIPAGLTILLPLTAVAFTIVCLVTSYAGTAQPTSVNLNGVSVPLNLDKAQLETWLLQHPSKAASALGFGPIVNTPFGGGAVSVQKGAAPVVNVHKQIERNISSIYENYVATQFTSLDPSINEMVKIGLWIELEVLMGFIVGLGLGSLIGQRTVTTVLMIVLEIVITPILANVTIPYFLNGQRLLVGVALDQLRPAYLTAAINQVGHGRRVFGAVAQIPPMPTWAMVSVIVAWLVGFTALGTWRMVTRDA